jgi:hypothetical protein
MNGRALKTSLILILRRNSSRAEAGVDFLTEAEDKKERV